MSTSTGERYLNRYKSKWRKKWYSDRAIFQVIMTDAALPVDTPNMLDKRQTKNDYASN